MPLLFALFAFPLFAGVDGDLEKAISESTASTAPAKTLSAPTANAFPFAEAFSTEKNPGSGTLRFSKATGEPLTITLGAESGHYISGLVFPNDALPPGLRDEFKNSDAIQLSFGTQPTSVGARIGQFGAVTLKVSRGTKPQRILPLKMPGMNEVPLAESGYLLFASPEMLSAGSDEEKLKNTFFAREGSLSLVATALPRSLLVLAGGRKIAFKIQPMRMDIEAILATPFNTEEPRLVGKVEYPLYYPDGASARAYLRQIAETTFNAKSSLRPPADLGRKITSEGPRKGRK
jgi:hypothetical protein